MDVMGMFLGKVLDVAVPVLGSALTILLGVGIRHIASRTKNDKIVEYADILSVYAEKVVSNIAQLHGDELKKASADGKLTAEERASLKKMAIDELKSIAPDVALEFQKKAGSDLDRLLGVFVESAVSELKKGNNNAK